MSNAKTSIPNNPILNNIDMIPTADWRAILHQRGIGDAAIDYAGIQPDPNGRGWRYKIAPHITQPRFKAFPGQRGAKYRWIPNQPANVPFYDPRGELAQHVSAANGVVYLAAGEPDTWVLFEAGLFNATCTLAGEGAIPREFVNKLRRLEVTTVILWPDCDPAGLRHAGKVAAALDGAGIAVDVRALPYAQVDKHGPDLNTLWLDCGRDRAAFLAALENCPPVILPEPEPERKRPRPASSSRAVSSNWNHYLADEFDPRVPAEWLEGKLSQKGFHKNTSCPNPGHTDGKPSFGYNPESRTGYCFVCGTFRTDDLAGFIGAPVYEPPHRLSQDTPAPVRQNSDKPHILPTRLVEWLLNLHGDTDLNLKRRDIPDAGAVANVLNDVYEQINAGLITPDDPITANGLITNSARGLSWDTANKGLVRGSKLGLFGVFNPNQPDQHDKGEKVRINGRTGKQYRLVPLSEALPALVHYLARHVLRVVLVREFPDVPVSAEYMAGLIKGLTPDDIATIDERCAGLYEHHAGDRAKAMDEYQRRMAFYRAKYQRGILEPSERYPVIPFELPPGVQTPNAAKFRNAVDDLDMQQHEGVRDAKARYRAARRTGRTMAAHRRSAQNRGIIAVPQAETYAIDPGVDVLSQIADLDAHALQRGAVELVAVNGARVYVREDSTRDYDDWAEQNGGAMVEIRRASIEKRADLVTNEEQAAVDDLSAYQSERAARRSGEITPQADHPVHGWLMRQGELRAAAFGLQAMPDHAPVIFIDAETGEIFERGDVWRGILASISKVRLADDTQTETTADTETETRPATMDRHDAGCIPAASEGHDSGTGSRSQRPGDYEYAGNRSADTQGERIDRRGDDQPGRQNSGDQRVYDREIADQLVSRGASMPFSEYADIEPGQGLPAPENRRCACCGAVATVQKLGGNYCAEHAELSLDERFALADEFQAGRKSRGFGS
jgi:hypothetical protein